MTVELDSKQNLILCHSFQLMCRKYQLGEINTRRSSSFGVLPVHQTKAGLADVRGRPLLQRQYRTGGRGPRHSERREEQHEGRAEERNERADRSSAHEELLKDG